MLLLKVVHSDIVHTRIERLVRRHNQRLAMHELYPKPAKLTQIHRQEHRQLHVDIWR